MLWVCVKYFLEPSSFSVLLFSPLAVAEVVEAVAQQALTGLQEPLGQAQRPDDVVGDHATGITDHVGLAVAEAE